MDNKALNIIGIQRHLYSYHGNVNTDSTLKALAYMSDNYELDISKLNAASEKGAILITDYGKILESTDGYDENLAKYKIVPTGLKLKYSDCPLLASFIRLNKVWEGAFIGTGIQLFEMYKEHYTNNSVPFDTEYLELFGDKNRNQDIIGFGKKQVFSPEPSSDCKTEYIDTKEARRQELEKAIARCKKEIESKAKSKSKIAKLKQRIITLENQLKKLDVDNDKQKYIKKDAQDKNSKIKLKTPQDIEWFEVVDIGECLEYFEDFETKAFNLRLVNSIDSDKTTEQDIISNLIIEENIYETEEPISTEIETDVDNPLIEEVITKSVSDDTKTIDTDSEEDSFDKHILESMDHDSDAFASSEKLMLNQALKVDLSNDIYSRLLIKEDWKYDNHNRILFYLKGILILVDESRKSTHTNLRGNGYLLNNDKSKEIVNTSLIDKYGNYIYIIDHTPYVQQFENKELSLLNNKASLLDWGFELKELRKLPSPVKFVNDRSSYIFNGIIEDFDLDDAHHLKHIVDERRHRFPSKYKHTPSDILSNKVKSAVEQAVMISKTDYKYIVPKYDFSRHKIQFLIPLHLDTAITDKPELVIVVSNIGGIWNINTVLETDSAYDDARLICRPCNSWLRLI